MENGLTLSTTLLNSLLRKEEQYYGEVGKGAVGVEAVDGDGDGDAVGRPDRDREVSWICSVGRRLHLGMNTVGLAVAIFDRVLSIVVVKCKYANCVALAALCLAVKFHEEGLPDEELADELEEAAFVSPAADALWLVRILRASSHYSLSELNRMERSLLAHLDWDLMLPSIDRFLNAMLIVVGIPHLADSHRLRHNFEACLSNGALSTAYRPSTVALSLLSLMLERSYAEWRRIISSLKEIFRIEDGPHLSDCRREVASTLKGQEEEEVEVEMKGSPLNSKAPPLHHRPASRKRPRRRMGLSASLESIDQLSNYQPNTNETHRKPALMSVDYGDGSIDDEVLHVLYSILSAQQD